MKFILCTGRFRKSIKCAFSKEMKQAIHHFIDIRDENVWMLFGTLPIYPCINDENDQALLQRLRDAKM